MVARFSVPVQKSPKVHPASLQWALWAPSWSKVVMVWHWTRTPSSAEVKDEYSYTSTLSLCQWWHVTWRPLPFTLHINLLWTGQFWVRTPEGGNIFSVGNTCLDWPWGPLSLLCSECCVSFPEHSVQGLTLTTPSPLSIEVKNGRTVHLLPTVPAMAYYGVMFYTAHFIS
jgi:hypothetical protein